MRHTPLANPTIATRADPSVARRVIAHLDRLGHGQPSAEDASEGLTVAVDLILGAITPPRDHLKPALHSDIDTRLRDLANYILSRPDADETGPVLIGLRASRVALEYWAEPVEARRSRDPNLIADISDQMRIMSLSIRKGLLELAIRKRGKPPVEAGGHSNL